jgi:hypothetical protein
MGNANAFCEVYNPDLQMAVAANESRAFFGSAPMLCTIDAAYGEGKAAAWLVPQLYDLCATVGVKTKMDDVQLKQLALMIRKEFGYLKATEVMLFLWRLKGGHYGEFYGSIDPLRIMRALRGRFIDERARVIDQCEKAALDRERETWRQNAATPSEIEEIKKRYQNESNQI